ncbi:MAG: heavy metal translocating P-type ATPase [Prevotella sp.]|nr:heavy metal translocating P-type ATPase [Prevotella sp.]
MEKKTLAVTGMGCTSCAANIERKLKGMNGIQSASVSFTSRQATIEYNPKVVTLEKMQTEVAKIGYQLITNEDEGLEKIEKTAYSKLLRKAILSWIFAILTMGISMGFIDVGKTEHANQLMFVIALFNILYCGQDFYKNAFRQLLHGMASMDTLVAMSTFISFIFSTFNTFWGEEFWTARSIENHTYFDASIMIITFVLTGRALEEKAKNSTASAIRDLMGLAPKTAHLVSEGTIQDVPIAALGKKDIIKVNAGEKIPVDGEITQGEAFIDQSMMTGEPIPVQGKIGDKVFAGMTLTKGSIEFRAEQVGSQTMLSHIIKMVQEAQSSKAPVERITDKIASIFVPTILCLAILTFLLWFIIGGQTFLPKAVISAVSVLVIACPCALGLATPTALMVGIGKAAKGNILIRDATALERIRLVDALVMDKTGTLTIPNKDVDFTSKKEIPLKERETLKPKAEEAIQMLHKKGVKVYLTSGDKPEAVAYWAKKAGIEEFFSQVLPQDKEDLVKKLQAEGHVVAMVGDGINDTQALAQADVSIAMGKGTDIAMDVAQVTLIGTDLRYIPDAFDLSRRTVNMIHQNLFWAFIYNIICIPLAAGIPWLFGVHWQITPMWAAALMAFSSISVVLNSLRLNFFSTSLERD